MIFIRVISLLLLSTSFVFANNHLETESKYATDNINPAIDLNSPKISELEIELKKGELDEENKLISISVAAEPAIVNISTSNNWVLLISVLSLCLSGYTLLQNRKENKENYERSINDDFWYRTILIPTLLEPTVKFFDDYANKLIILESEKNPQDIEDTYRIYFLDFQKELNLIQGRCVLAKIYGEDLYQNITTNLEQLEDKMAEFCHNKSLQRLNDLEDEAKIISETNGSEFIFEYLRNFIEIIKKQHSQHKF